MPVTVSFPGVYIEEIPSGVRTITGVATSITAFLGRSLRGPVDKAATINSFGDFERIFGGLWADSSMSFAVRDFYLNGGSQAVIVRMFREEFDNASQIAAHNKALTAAGDVAGAVKGTEADAKAAAAAALAKAAEIQGSKAEKAAANAVARAAVAASQLKNATVASVKAAADAAVQEAADRAAGFAKAELSVNGLNLKAADAGAWGNFLRARVDHETEPPTTDLFNLFIRDDQTGQLESFRNVSVLPGSPRRIDKLLESESKLVRVETLPASRPTPHGTTPDEGKGIWDDNSTPTNSKVTTKFSSDGIDLDQEDLIGHENDNRGLFALKKVDLFNLLCIPPYRKPGPPDNNDVDQAVITRAITFCKQRRAFLLIDPPLKWKDKDQARDGIGDLGEPISYSAVFFPRLRQPNPLRGNAVEDFAPCGAVAGVFARTDAQRGVWKAPAGLEATLIGVPELSVKLNDPENGELNPLGINCLRSIPAAGPVVWGARTREGDNRLASEWKYTPVRRTALFIEESLFRGTQWVVFEPNDEPLWAQIRLNVGAFMNNLFRQGAFQGKTPREAYLVKCDKETTTQNDINLGIVNIVVGFAPLKPAEFVILKIQQLAGQIET
ncbi:MAG TPA: phage tail sheath C-terminal domain-containing protein [Thermoanaerobaculia bacterium]|nr:phage tail sheath C-terminal domain-containing protein [Thermoanaerobaculia bacterium]